MATKSSGNATQRTIRLATICFLAALTFVFFRLTSTAAEGGAEPQRRSKSKGRTETSAAGQMAASKYSKFSHTIEAHKQPCSNCHKFPSPNWRDVRKGDDAFADITEYPEHASCIGCHRQQFFSGAQPAICWNCHVSPGPRSPARYPFPSLGEAFDKSPRGQIIMPEFAVYFPHDKHIEMIEGKGEETDPKSCGVCHQLYQPQGDSDDEFVTKPPKGLADDAFWLKKGTFRTSPRTHAICFTCHTADSGLAPAPSNCNACHKLLPAGTDVARAHDDFDPKLAAEMGIKDRFTLIKWSRRDTAKFRHEWAPHAALNCTSCHNIATLNTLDRKTTVQVKSCGGEGTGCHIEATGDGALNIEFAKKKADPAFQCTKCHIANGKRQFPESHAAAIAAAQKR